MAKFMEIKSINPRLQQSEKARELKMLSSTLKRYRRERKMLSPHRIPPSPNTNTRKEKTSNHTEHNLKMTLNDLKMTSNDLKRASNEKDRPVFEKVKTKNNLGGNFSNENRSQGRYFIEQDFSSQ